MKKFIHLLKREFKIFLANDTLRSVFILGPIVYGLLIGFTYKEGKVDNLPVIVIDQDHTPTSSTVVDMLGDNKTIKVLHYAQEPLRLEDEVITRLPAPPPPYSILIEATSLSACTTAIPVVSHGLSSANVSIISLCGVIG